VARFVTIWLIVHREKGEKDLGDTEFRIR